MAGRSFLEQLYGTPVGHALARRAGLADPPVLRRGRVLPAGPLGLGAAAGGTLGERTLAALGLASTLPLRDEPDRRTRDDRGREQPPAYHARLGALIVDATGVRRLGELEQVRALLRPAMRGIEKSGRVILIADDASAVEGLEAKVVAQALDGLSRTVGKELRGGATCNLVACRAGVTPADLASTLSFLLEGRSAFVDGQTIHLGPAKPGDAAGGAADPSRPFAGRIVVVTGAARGIGAAISRVFARDGATVVGVDMPQSGQSLAAVTNEIRGSALQLDITSPEAGDRIAAHVTSRYGADARIWAIVHNAGITRDKLLANLDEARWAQVLQVNLAAEMALNEVLLDPRRPGGLSEPGRIVGIASTSGVAGNRGQANYAASKAGVMGLVRAMSEQLRDRPVTTNAVAPGFIETDMTAAIPFVQREVFRRSNSLAQGGRPVDVAETIAWLCDPASGGIDGQIVRVCGQNLVGA